MQPDDRDHLTGLVARPELNRQLGTVEQVGTERATVRLDSGLTVSAMHAACRREPDQHQDPNREPDHEPEHGTWPPACTSPHVLALASPGLVASVCTEPSAVAEQNQDSSFAREAPTWRKGSWHRQWPLPSQPQRLIAALRNGEELPCPLPEEALPCPLLEVSDGEPSPVASGNRRKRQVRVRHWWNGLWTCASVSSSSSRAALHAKETCNAIADYEEARAPCYQQ